MSRFRSSSASSNIIVLIIVLFSRDGVKEHNANVSLISLLNIFMCTCEKVTHYTPRNNFHWKGKNHCLLLGFTLLHHIFPHSLSHLHWKSLLHIFCESYEHKQHSVFRLCFPSSFLHPSFLAHFCSKWERRGVVKA